VSRRRQDVPPQPSGEEIDLGDLVDEVAGVGVPPLDDLPEPKLVARIRFYLYVAMVAVMRAIRLQSVSDSLREAMEPLATEARLDAKAGLAETRVQNFDVQITTLNRILDRAYSVLGSWQGRSWWDTRRKLIFWGILLVADTGTIAGIAYSVGDPLFLAIPLGLGAGASAITLGLLASDHRKHKERARRAGHQPKGTEEFDGFFVADVRESRLQIVFAAMILVLLAGILALRIGTSGEPLMGMGFGFIAGATFLASWVSCWYHTCEIHDYLDGLERRRDALAAKQDPEVAVIGARDEAKRRADTIRKIGMLTGKAGAQAAKGRLIARGPMENPAVYGHGTAFSKQPASAPAPPTGTPTTSNGHGPTVEPEDLADFPQS
jgi:hypothetical protein